MPCSSDYLYYAAHRLTDGGESPPWSAFKLALLATAAAAVPLRSGVSLDDVELAIAAPEGLVDVDLDDFVDTPYSPDEWVLPDEPPDPPTNPEVTPYSTVEIAAGSWTNGTEETVTARTLALVGWNAAVSRYELLIWRAIDPEAEIEPEASWPAAPITLVARIVEHADGDDLSEARIVYETANHRTAGKHAAAEDEPSRLTWAEIHDVVPALGAEFKAALERLERLLYAWCGSVPKSYSPFLDWYHREHPRCLWFPEQFYKAGCSSECNRFLYEFYETAAFGDTKTNRMPRPKVPMRSRSGDWKLQVLDRDRPRDRAHFPIMSVERDDGSQVDLDGRQLYDPKGTGSFGGDPTQVGADGDVAIAGEAVEIRYTPPEGLTVLAATLKSSAGDAAMSEAGGVWSASIAAQAHATTVQWWLEVEFDDGEGGSYLRYEPGGAAPPVDDDKYSYVAFTHYNPYPRGLPELWDKCKKGTDGYEFTGEETIQYELINLVRFILDYIGARFYHSPRLRSTVPKCCLLIPIEWRWSGSAPWPHFVSGGKSGVSPLHDQDLDEGDHAGRDSWRGSHRAFGDEPEWPQDEMEASWLAMPWVSTADLVSDGLGSCEQVWDGAKRGLQAGDAIVPVHIQELIAAIDHLIDSGVWTTAAIKRRVATPTSTFHHGSECGDSWDHSTGDAYNPEYGCFEDCTGDPLECDAWDPPASWQACWEDASPSTSCQITQKQGKSCAWFSGSGWITQSDSWFTLCRSNAGDYGNPSLTGLCGVGTGGFPLVGGTAAWTCFATLPFEVDHSLTLAACGWDAYICGPRRCPLGPDSDHGNNSKKLRYDDTCQSGGPDRAFGGETAFSMGNCFGDSYSCAVSVETGEGTVSFEDVEHFIYRGWESALSEELPGLCADEGACACHGDDSIDIPGYVGKWDWQEPPVYMCASTCYPEDETGLSASSNECTLDLTDICSIDEVYVAIDLNLDGSGTPYANHGEGGYSGDRMPTLRDYDETPTPDPIAFPVEEGPYDPQVECPCDTATSELVCADF